LARFENEPLATEVRFGSWLCKNAAVASNRLSTKCRIWSSKPRELVL
jgi:hypothetical protein